MENLELSLSSLGIISRNVDKSHNELSQYLAKQVRYVSLLVSLEAERVSVRMLITPGMEPIGSV